MDSGGGNNLVKLGGAFALGLAAAGLGVMIFGGSGSSRPAQPKQESPLAVVAPAVEAEPVASVPAESESVRHAQPPAPPTTRPAAPAPKQRKSVVEVASATRPSMSEPPPPSTPAARPVVQNASPQPPPQQQQPEPAREEPKQPQPSTAQIPVAPPAPVAASVTLKAGLVLNVVLAERLSTETNKENDAFTATLAQPIVVDGLVIAEKNSKVRGRVVQAERAGKVKGNAALSLELTQLTTSDGQKVAIRTSPFLKQSEASHKDDAKKVAIGSAIGAAIGAIAGGGKGAAIGAGAGAGAGGGAVLATRGKDAELEVESRLTFRLSDNVTLTEKLAN